MTCTQSRIRLRPTAIFRSLLLSLAVFAIAALAGVLISGSAPAGPARPENQPEPVSQEHVTTAAADPTFAESMIYSGAIALGLSVFGLVMVVRRRRQW